MLFLTNGSPVWEGEVNTASRRQLRLITVLLRFDRPFSGWLRIPGTNYEPAEAALVRARGPRARGPPAGRRRLFS